MASLILFHHMISGRIFMNFAIYFELFSNWLHWEKNASKYCIMSFYGHYRYLFIKMVFVAWKQQTRFISFAGHYSHCITCKFFLTNIFLSIACVPVEYQNQQSLPQERESFHQISHNRFVGIVRLNVPYSHWLLPQLSMNISQLVTGNIRDNFYRLV